jgi:hypothetical protein
VKRSFSYDVPAVPYWTPGNDEKRTAPAGYQKCHGQVALDNYGKIGRRAKSYH